MYTFIQNFPNYIFVHDFTNWQYIIYFNNVKRQKFFLRRLPTPRLLTHPQTYFHAIFTSLESADLRQLFTKKAGEFFVQ